MQCNGVVGVESAGMCVSDQKIPQDNIAKVVVFGPYLKLGLKDPESYLTATKKP